MILIYMGFLKGSQEAKDHMSRIRAMKGNISNTTEKRKMMFAKCAGRNKIKLNISYIQYVI